MQINRTSAYHGGFCVGCSTTRPEHEEIFEILAQLKQREIYLPLCKPCFKGLYQQMTKHINLLAQNKLITKNQKLTTQ